MRARRSMTSAPRWTASRRRRRVSNGRRALTNSTTIRGKGQRSDGAADSRGRGQEGARRGRGRREGLQLTEDTGSGGGVGRPTPVPDDEAALVRHEEEAHVDTRWEEVGHARVRREVTSHRVREQHPRRLEELAHERVPVTDNHSGEVEVLPDGSVSIPLFEEELVVTRRQVLRERVVIRKELVTDWETIDVELRREHVAFETDDAA